MIYIATDLSPNFTSTDTTAAFEGFEFWFYIETHVHSVVIPVGAINGVNTTYAVTADQMEVIINGLHVTFTATVGGFTLDTAPTAGDIIWCEVINE